MNTTKFKLITIVILLASCSSETTQSQQEEIQYREYASLIGKSVSSLNPKERAKADENAYKESGLQDFIYGPGDYLNAQDKTLTDLDDFYERVIIGKYAGRYEQEELRVKFINYAVTAFNLTHRESPDDTQHLIKYTRELMKNDNNLNAGLSYKCLSAIKGLIDKDEYNAMVKKAKFHTRFAIEEFQKTLATQKESDPKQPYDQMRRVMETYMQYQSDFDALMIK